MARYIYDKTNHVEIPITGDPDPTNFVGTLAQWEALTQAEKNLYDSVDLTDDYNDVTEDINDIKNDIGVISNLDTDDKTNLVAAINEVNSKAAGGGGVMIAGTEETSTASRAYLPEQYLIYNEFLYRVIESIALGDTLVPDTNIKQVTIGGELSSHLSINGVPFYFDSHDGQYGYNTSSSRGADTFVPFSNLDDIYDAVVAKGVTPTDKTVAAIVTAINSIATDVKHTVGVTVLDGRNNDQNTYVYIDGALKYNSGWTDHDVSVSYTI